MKIHNSNTNQKEITSICRRYHRLGSNHTIITISHFFNYHNNILILFSSLNIEKRTQTAKKLLEFINFDLSGGYA